VEVARDRIDTFLLDTGVTGSAPPRRYLWTDAYAACTLLALDADGLEPAVGDGASYRELALRLVDQVHHVLGRHRDDDLRHGWISGLDEEEGAEHPTAGGLRIGKPRPERAPDDPENRQQEWDRDGQYFHYLTRWMHALRRVAMRTGDPVHLRRAVELAKAAWRGFVHTGADGRETLFWKMSVDLSRPLVRRSGHHDALDGYLTFRDLAAPGPPAPASEGGTGLGEEIAGLARLAGLDDPEQWITHDPLGIGSLLNDAWRVGRLRARGVAVDDGLLPRILHAADRSYQVFRQSRYLDQPPARRLPFRELGLSQGVHALERLADRIDEGVIPGPAAAAERGLSALLEATATARRIEGTWAAEESRTLDVWREHRDINGVMLATSFLPDGFLGS
jgi:hypothetical protein